MQGPNPLSRSFTVACGPAELSLSASVSPSPLLSDEPATWTITLQNTGESPTAGQITVIATLPLFDESTALLDVPVASGAGWSCALALRSDARTLDTTCTRTGSVAPGASAPPISISTANVYGCGAGGQLFLPAIPLQVTAQGGGAPNSDVRPMSDAPTSP